MPDKWRVFGVRPSPDGEIVFVGHSRGPWTRRPGRNKALEAWLRDNPDHEEVLLAEAPDRKSAMRLAARLVREEKPALQRKRGRVANRRLAGKPAAGPGRAKAPVRAAGLRDYASRSSLERALAAAGWTFDEEISILVKMARDPGHARQLDALKLLREYRAGAEEDEVEDAAMTKFLKVGREITSGPVGPGANSQPKEGRDAEEKKAAAGAGSGADGGADRAGGDSGCDSEGRDRVQGRAGGAGGGAPAAAGTGDAAGGDGVREEHEDGAVEDAFGWHKPSERVPGCQGLAG